MRPKRSLAGIVPGLMRYNAFVIQVATPGTR